MPAETSIKTNPLPHQSKAFERLKDLHNAGLFWTMGRGKTKTAIDLAVYHYMHGHCGGVLIVAPKLVHQQWVEQQIPAHCGIPYRAHAFVPRPNKGQVKQFREFMGGCAEDAIRFLAVHVDFFSQKVVKNEYLDQFIRMYNPMIILDEATRVKNPSSLRTKALSKLRRTLSGPALVLTGTALAKRPSDVWSIMEFMDYDILKQGYIPFRNRYCLMQRSEFQLGNGKSVNVQTELTEQTYNRIKAHWKNASGKGMSLQDFCFSSAVVYGMHPNDMKFVVESPVYVKYRYLDELKERLDPVVDFITPQDDVQLPPKKMEEFFFPLDKVQKDLIRDLKQNALATYGDGVLTLSTASALYTKALQICGGFLNAADIHGRGVAIELKCPNPKLQYIIDDIDELGGAQFIVFAVFREEIKMLVKKLSQVTSVRAIYGDVTDLERQEALSKFASGEVQGLIMNPSVGGYGMNLQNATTQYWYSRSYNTEDRLQAEGRSQRIGTVVSPVYKDLVYDCEFERRVLESNRTGKSMQEFFTGLKSVEEIFGQF